MDITIIGTGNMARGIALRALAGDHSVTLLGTETEKAEALAGELSGDVGAGQVGDPLAGDVVVLAVWYAAVDDVLSRYGGQLDGKVVVDITNPIDVDAFEPLKLEAGSAAQEIAAKIPGAKVVKAFNTTFAGTLGEGRVAGQPLDVFIASDADDAKATVIRIVTDAGLRPDRRGPAQARARARGARLPPHGAAAATRHRLLERGEGSRLAARTSWPPGLTPAGRRPAGGGSCPGAPRSSGAPAPASAAIVSDRAIATQRTIERAAVDILGNPSGRRGGRPDTTGCLRGDVNVGCPRDGGAGQPAWLLRLVGNSDRNAHVHGDIGSI
jgi:8-hydroxy-5-deazaflavin:NADPH oxidoreductase